MIKAPFRFDVEYFSIVVTYALSPSPVKHFFRDQKEKDNYLSSLRKSGTVSSHELKEINQQNFYLEGTHCKPCLYIIVQNNGTKEFFCSFCKNEELSVQLKALFGDLVSLYSFIREHCNSQQIKLTKNGNIIIYYQIQDTLYTFKLQNHPTPIKRISIEDIWDTIKQSWDRRKEPGNDRSLQQCFNNIRKGNISIYGKTEQKKLSSDDMSVEESYPRERTRDKNYARDKKLQKTAAKKWDSSDQEDRQVPYNARRYEPYEEEERSPYSSRKSKTILKDYPYPYPDKRKYKPKYRMDRKMRDGRYYQEEDQSSYEPAKKEKVAEYPPTQLAQLHRFISTFKKDLEEVKKTTSLYSQLETSISQNLEAKFELFSNTVKESLGILDASLQNLPERINQNSIAEEFTDEDNKNAYLLFYADKMPLFREHFHLKDSFLIEDFLKKLWKELSLAQKTSYYKELRAPLKEEPLKLKKSGKGEQGQPILEEELESKSEKDLNESMEEEQVSVNNNDESHESRSKEQKSDS